MNIIGWIVAVIVVTIAANVLNLQWLIAILAVVGVIRMIAEANPSKGDGVNNNTTEQNHANGNNRSDGKENLG